MTDRVLVGDAPPARRTHRAQDAIPGNPWQILMFVGLALAVIGWTDFLLTFVPAEWASLEWEIGTLIAGFDALPLGTLGFALIAASVVARHSTRGAKVSAVFAGVVALVLLAMLAILGLDSVPAIQSVTEQVSPMLKKALLKAGIMAVVYISLYSTMSVWLLRLARAQKGAGIR